jgi:cysteine desulfurase
MKKIKDIYLDNAATTKVDERVVKTMMPYFTEKYGNPSSQHYVGGIAKQALEKARELIAKSINSSPEEIIFTSGGTESNNLALKGLFEFWKENGKNHIITSKIEHDSILNVCKKLEKEGAKITYVDVDKNGLIDWKNIKKAMTEKTFLISIIHGNNEVGTLQNLEEIGNLAKSHGISFHTDACQSYTKSEINVKKQNLDLVTLNSHKIHGPKGVGILYIKKGTNIMPLIHGGGHEKNLRSGTENLPGIVGFAKAVEVSDLKDVKKMIELRDYLIKNLLKIPKTKLNGINGNQRLCNNINVSFSNIEGEAIASQLERYGICISTGSACASHSLKKSHVLRAMGLDDFEINSSIRISLSKYTKKQEIDYFLEKLNEIVKNLRKISPFD